MTNEFDKTIQEIAIKHGVVLSKDDPILILHTMNENLLAETRQAQALMLTQFREEMEKISSQWKDDAKEKAEKILNVALTGSKEAMARLLQESTSESVQAMKKVILAALTETRDLTLQTRKFSRFTLLLSTAMLIASGLFMLPFSFIFG
ncbi:conjugal transfer protein TraM [Legionella nautarum]|uniref:Conjugal transfer protein TraM n=1 Tax=Legionella nautarum TaxID=45070 RepID=A0A0W0WNE2_9GAMM|nr:conjugal transfer protein TraM [Legionella nautarum]KTD33837.1 conjugal transfer protein TraM [Legionella nautarum]